MDYRFFNLNNLLTGIILAASIISCKPERQKEKEKAIGSHAKDKVPGVCIWDGIAIRKEPSRNSSMLSTLSLGESFLYLNEEAIDSAYKNQKYLNIELSDGSVGWAAGFGLIMDAKTGVVKSKVPLYKRPDLLTISNKEFSPMDIIAVTEETDNWAKVTGEKKRMEGWIKMSYISYNKEDIAFALLAKRELNVNDEKPLPEKIQGILDDNPYPNSIFVEVLREIAREEENKQKLNQIMREIN
jgi:ribosome biogenesis protein Tsr3